MGAATPQGHGAHSNHPIVFHLGREELVIRDRYETISITNDLLIGTWFLVGSFFFFSPTLTHLGTWLFLLGSIEMLIRPVIRFTRRVHLRRYRPDDPVASDGADDF